MAAALLVVFLVVPIVELAVIIQVGQLVGVVPTLAVLIIVSIVGASLMKREGLGVWRRARQQMGTGRVPGREVADGFLIVLGGALMLTPGFVTDGVGLALLLPPVRAAIRPFLLRQLQVRTLGTTLGTGRRSGGGPSGGRSDVIDV